MKEIRLTDDADYAKAHANLQALIAREDDLRRRRTDAVNAHRAAEVKTPRRLGSRLVVAVGSGGHDAELPALPDLAPLERDLAEVEAAVGLQREELAKNQSAAASRLCVQLVPDYRAALLKLRESLVAFGKAADAVAMFREHYENACGLPLVHPLMVLGIESHVFSTRNDQSRLSAFLRRVEEALAYLPPEQPAAPPPTPAPISPAPVIPRRAVAPSRS